LKRKSSSNANATANFFRSMGNAMSAHRPVILLAEDDDDDSFLLGRALNKSGLDIELVRVRDGQEVISYLEGTEPYDNRDKYPAPRLVLLDIKMPRMNGFDVLTWRSANEPFKSLPVVMFSGSGLEKDKKKARELGAADYLVKPSSTEALIKVMHKLHERWLLPEQRDRK